MITEVQVTADLDITAKCRHTAGSAIILPTPRAGDEEVDVRTGCSRLVGRTPIMPIITDKKGTRDVNIAAEQ